MSEEISKEILEELKKINEKLARLNEPKGLSTSMKIVALFVGFMVIGPLIGLLLSDLFR